MDHFSGNLGYYGLVSYVAVAKNGIRFSESLGFRVGDRYFAKLYKNCEIYIDILKNILFICNWEAVIMQNRGASRMACSPVGVLLARNLRVVMAGLMDKDEP
jgi:hypothetical protein